MGKTIAQKIIDAHLHFGASVGRMVPDQSVESLVALMDKLDIEKAYNADAKTKFLCILKDNTLNFV